MLFLESIFLAFAGVAEFRAEKIVRWERRNEHICTGSKVCKSRPGIY